MTIAERFDRFIATTARMNVLEQQLKDLKNERAADEAFVKDWFRSRKPDGGRHRGVVYSKRSQRRLDVKKARILLGAKASQAEVTIEAESLALDTEARAVREALAAPLKPLRVDRQAATG